MSAVTTATSSERLALEPLRIDHAEEMTPVLADPTIYEFMGGEAPTTDELVERYGHQVVGPSSSDEVWHNWILRRKDTGDAAGFVQATVEDEAADVAWVVGVAHQRRGYATEAAKAMVVWLRSHGVDRITAHIHPDHRASGNVAMAVGLSRSGAVDEDGEEIWVSDPLSPEPADD